MSDQYFKELLRSRSLKATSHRLSLLIKLQEYSSAMPYSAIQKAMKSMDRVTLYRTLESLKEKGIIHKAFQGNNESYYAICGKKCSNSQHDHDHVHFKCVKCESVTCEVPSKKVEISIPNIDIHKVSVHLEGVCNLCKS
jgi:Fe2+/Zn2+ uptake regulation proteins